MKLKVASWLSVFLCFGLLALLFTEKRKKKKKKKGVKLIESEPLACDAGCDKAQQKVNRGNIELDKL